MPSIDRTPRSTLERIGATLAVAAAPIVASGCEPYRVEYHKRPGFYYEAVEGELQDEWIAHDGTLVKFSRDTLPSEDDALAAKAEAAAKPVDRDGDGVPDPREPTPLWEEHDDGSVTMRAFLPQHVVGNLMRSLREERYAEFHDQLLAPDMRRQFDEQARGKGREMWIRWCRKNRRALMETLNRMTFGYMTSDVVLRQLSNDTYRLDFTPRLAPQFQFTSIDVVYNGPNASLLRIGTKGGNGGRANETPGLLPRRD
jgi:hypothetical protein